MCPWCRVGAHRDCRGRTWSVDTQSVEECTCAARAHQDRCRPEDQPDSASDWAFSDSHAWMRR